MGSNPPAKGKPKTAPVHETAKVGDGKHYALKLTLGGAPPTLHVIPGLGYVHGGRPAPVGEVGEPTLERAVEFSKRPGAAVELVELTDKQAETARKQMRESLLDANRALAKARREDAALPQDRIDDEQAALVGREA